MRVLLLLLVGILAPAALSLSTDGIYDLVKRRLPQHADSFEFSLVNETEKNATVNDQYVISSTSNGKILVEGNSLSALSLGLYRYLSDVAHVGIYWFIGSRLDTVSTLPSLATPLTGSSVVPWRYHFNTVTFSYTAAFWSWDDWELQLDWMALHGINLPLAWVGAEKILVEVFRELGLTDSEILTFLSGPAFQPWNRLGNIQGAWGGGEISFSWIYQQFEMQLQIVSRMAELGMTPVLPAFSGYVPRAITRVLPNATVVNGSQWDEFPTQYTNDTFLEPSDPNFAAIQKSFISKQQAAYGSNITHIYTLDQYNENAPYSGVLDYLKNVTRNTWQSLKAADPEAVWMMQGWLFYANSAFWTADRIEAFLSGVETNSDMIILDLVSDAVPLWQATNSYYGKPWIWCQTHDYGGNMGFMGRVLNITQNATQALAASESLVGFGNTMEGQEGNEAIYDLLLHQAWSSTPIDTERYFHDWVTARYGPNTPPAGLYAAWEILRTSVYNNTNPNIIAVPWPVVVDTPAIGIGNVTGITALPYNPSLVVEAWSLLYNSAKDEPLLWETPSYQHDLVDLTRQVLENAFIPRYQTLTDIYTGTTASREAIFAAGKVLIDLLGDLDIVLATNKNFLLSTWLTDARSWAGDNSTIADFFEYDARNIITLWGPNGEIKDYASKSWAGLMSSYYTPRWKIFVEYLVSTPASAYNKTVLSVKLLDFAQQWQNEKTPSNTTVSTTGQLKEVLEQVVKQWPDIFNFLLTSSAYR